MFASNCQRRNLLSLPGRDKTINVQVSDGAVSKALRLGGWRHRLHSVKLPSGDQLTLIEDMAELARDLARSAERVDKEWNDEP